VDFGFAGYLPESPGERPRKAWVFVMTLSFSRHQYAEIVFDQSVETWIALHVRALESFGGVMRRVVIDNLKAGIAHAVVHDAAPQRSYRELAEHYGFLISPCRPRTPRHKGKVESGVHYLKRNALAGRRFQCLAEANAELARWVREVAGQRDHGTTRQAPLERFESESAALAPLPPERYELATWAEAKLHPDCHLNFQYNRYSAPFRFVGQTLTLRASAERLEIYQEFERVASHRRARGRGQWVTHPEHYPPEKVVGLLPEPVRLRAEALRIGPRTGEFIERLLGDRAMDRARGAQSVLRLESRYGKERIESACSRALAFDEIRCHTVRSILERDLDLAGDQDLLAAASGPLPKTSRFARSAAELAARN
jgi:hypothetical protein